MQMDKRDVEAEQSNMKGGESAGGGFANPGEHGLGGGYTGTLKDITGGQTGGFKDLTGRAPGKNLVRKLGPSKRLPSCHKAAEEVFRLRCIDCKPSCCTHIM